MNNLSSPSNLLRGVFGLGAAAAPPISSKGGTTCRSTVPLPSPALTSHIPVLMTKRIRQAVVEGTCGAVVEHPSPQDVKKPRNSLGHRRHSSGDSSGRDRVSQQESFRGRILQPSKRKREGIGIICRGWRWWRDGLFQRLPRRGRRRGTLVFSATAANRDVAQGASFRPIPPAALAEVPRLGEAVVVVVAEFCVCRVASGAPLGRLRLGPRPRLLLLVLALRRWRVPRQAHHFFCQRTGDHFLWRGANLRSDR